MSKIVIGALTAAAWFALCYVARGEGIYGPTGKQETSIAKYVGHPISGALIRGPGIETAFLKPLN